MTGNAWRRKRRDLRSTTLLLFVAWIFCGNMGANTGELYLLFGSGAHISKTGLSWNRWIEFSWRWVLMFVGRKIVLLSVASLNSQESRKPFPQTSVDVWGEKEKHLFHHRWDTKCMSSMNNRFGEISGNHRMPVLHHYLKRYRMFKQKTCHWRNHRWETSGQKSLQKYQYRSIDIFSTDCMWWFLFTPFTLRKRWSCWQLSWTEPQGYLDPSDTNILRPRERAAETLAVLQKKTHETCWHHPCFILLLFCRGGCFLGIPKKSPKKKKQFL